MKRSIVADAGPLIGLARADLLYLLPLLFDTVTIPIEVHRELNLSTDRHGNIRLIEAFQAGWLLTLAAIDGMEDTTLSELLDPGEAAALLLAKARSSPFLIDERHGRLIAQRRGVEILGTGAVLIAAKRHGELASVGGGLKLLASQGYRLSDRLCATLLRLAGE